MTEREESTSSVRLEGRLIRLEGSLEHLGRNVTTLAESVDRLLTKQVDSGKTNWTLVLSGLAVFLTVITGVVSIQSYDVNSKLTPVILRQEYVERDVNKNKDFTYTSREELQELKNRTSTIFTEHEARLKFLERMLDKKD